MHCRLLKLDHILYLHSHSLLLTTISREHLTHALQVFDFWLQNIGHAPYSKNSSWLKYLYFTYFLPILSYDRFLNAYKSLFCVGYISLRLKFRSVRPKSCADRQLPNEISHIWNCGSAGSTDWENKQPGEVGRGGELLIIMLSLLLSWPVSGAKVWTNQQL